MAGPSAGAAKSSPPRRARAEALSYLVLDDLSRWYGGVPCSALATRDLMQSLREAGTITGGPRPFSRTDRSAFLSALDAADYLDTEERQVAYIAAALESGDADFVRDALGLVARARGMAGIAKKAGLNRESLYKAFNGNAKPEFETVRKVIKSFGLKLVAEPIETKRVA